jgi:hypothetical protein
MLDVKNHKENIMKMMILALTTVLSTVAASAATCPNYNGNFMCKNETMEQAMSIKTEVVDGVYHYSLDESKVIADGVTRPVEYQGGVFDIAATCTEEKVTVKIVLPGGEGDNEACGVEKWDLFYTLNFHPNGANITEKHFSETVCASGTVIPNNDNDQLECTPVP